VHREACWIQELVSILLADMDNEEDDGSEIIAPPPIELVRTKTDGGIPIYRGDDLRVIDQAEKNFDGLTPELDRVWFGKTTFEVAGDQWTIDEFLNFGAEGQTYSVIQAETGQRYAAKFCSDQNSLEVSLLQSLPQALVSHPNFLTYLQLVTDVSSVFSYARHIIFMEHVPNGELFEFIASGEASVAGKPVSQGTCRRFLQDVISGMAECYRYGITHRDLKPENLLINAEGRIIIIDMGHAKRTVPQVIRCNTAGEPPPLARATTRNRYGTEAFNAPESVTGKSYDCQQSDIWAIGVIAFMLHGKLPAFSQGGGVADWKDITGPDNDGFWKKIQSSGYYSPFPDDMKKFLNCLWRKDPAERPNFLQLDDALRGEPDVLQQFPGLEWLNQPVNDMEDFMAELRRTQPSKTFTVGSSASPQRW